MTQKLLLIYLKLILSCFIWGATFIVGRVIVQQLDPYTTGFCRFAIATLCLLLITQFQGGLPVLKRPQIPWVVMLGLSGVFAYNVLFFLGLQTVPASRAALIVALNPCVIALGSALLLHEKLTPLRIIGIFTSLVGTFFVITNGQWQLSGSLSWGDLYLLGCVFCWAIYTLLSKRVVETLSPLAATTYACLVGTVALFFVALPRGLGQLGQLSPLAWLGLIFLGYFSSAIAFNWYNEGLMTLGAARAAIFINLVPVFAILLAVYFLGETLTPAVLLGAGLVITGVYCTNRR